MTSHFLEGKTAESQAGQATGPSRRSMDDEYDDGPSVSLVDLLTWIGQGKRLIAACAVAAMTVSIIVVLLMPAVYTARATLLPPGSQQQSGSAAALAALGALGGIGGGLSAKTPDEMYVALLKSDSVVRALDARFDLRARYKAKTFESLRKAVPNFIHVSADKKSGVISVDVDDQDPKFAANLANAHAGEMARVLGRLAVTEAQQRRNFFEQQLAETKENLIKAEQGLRRVQERSGVIVLDKQVEALIGGAATLRAQIAQREVQLKVLRTAATDRNPEVMRRQSELNALRAELSRMENAQAASGGASGAAAGDDAPNASPVDIPVGRLPEASIEYLRARRELKLQETLLESMVRQFEIAKLDEAKEGPNLQQIDVALPPDAKSKPARSLIVIGSTLAAVLLSTAWVVVRRYSALARAGDPESGAAWDAMRRAWRLRGT